MMNLRLFQPVILTNLNRLFPEGKMTVRTWCILSLGVLICLAIYLVTAKTVGYFHDQNELGIILSLKLFQMAWITIFAMLIFSSMITAVSTLYLSNDNEIILAAPLASGELFLMRYFTTSLYTSWMMLIFSLPVFGAFGQIFEAGLLFWPLLTLSVFSTAAVASASAMLITVPLVYFFPAKRTKDIVFYLSLCFGIFLYLIFRMMRPEDLVNPEKYSQFVEYLSAVSAPVGPWLPAGWAANMLTSYLLDRDVDLIFLGLLITTPFVIYFCGEWAMSRWFMGGFNKSQESFGGHRTFRTIGGNESPRAWIFRKERKLFLRDSSEWSQLFMVGALIVVYLYNFKVLPLDRAPMSTEYLTNLIAWGNVGLSGFLAASLSARFVYPSIGAEGGAFYLILSSPLSPARYLWYKYLFYLPPFTLLTLVLILVSNYLLQIDGPMWWISLTTGLIITWTVLAMALGFGTLFADFKAENKAASMGPGAIIYLFSAISYELVVIFLGTRPTYRMLRHWLFGHDFKTGDFLLFSGWLLAILIFSILLGVIICKKGINKQFVLRS